MAKNNALNNNTQELTIDPGASGDSFLQFNINTTGEFRVGVDDTDDSFRMSQGSALGTSDTFIMTAAGERTMPLQSAFFAHFASNDNNRVGSAGGYVLGTNTAFTEIFDQNSDFNTNGTFTAPTTGRYLLYSSAKVGGVTSGMTRGRQFITTSNRGYLGRSIGVNNMRTAADEITTSITLLADMDSGDTAITALEYSGTSDVGDILGQATNPITYFCGALIV